MCVYVRVASKESGSVSWWVTACVHCAQGWNSDSFLLGANLGCRNRFVTALERADCLTDHTLMVGLTYTAMNGFA